MTPNNNATAATRLKLVVAVSGSGRTLENFLHYQQRNDALFLVCGVVASRADIRAVQICREQNIDYFVGDFSGSRSDSERSLENKVLESWLVQKNCELIALSGFLKKFPLLATYEKKIINIHPALLPDFGGKGMYGNRVHEAVLASGKKFSGATVHFVDAEYDRGAIVAQTKVNVLAGDNVQSLSARVFAAECQLYPEVINRIASKKLPLADSAIWFHNDD